MKTQNLRASLRNLILAAIATASIAALAQDAVINTPSQLSYGVPQILQLSQAKVGDDVIVRYIQNSGTIFALKAPEIVYLKQQGVSDTVLNAMIDQRIRLTGSTEPATSPQVNLTAAQPSVIVQPVAYVPTIPSSSVYVI